jgi:uncharacterized protein YecT (DUF1311 family)
MHPTRYSAKAYSAASQRSPLASTKIKRRDSTDRDVQIEICITADVEVIAIRKVNEAYERLLKPDEVPLLHRYGVAQAEIT